MEQTKKDLSFSNTPPPEHGEHPRRGRVFQRRPRDRAAAAPRSPSVDVAGRGCGGRCRRRCCRCCCRRRLSSASVAPRLCRWPFGGRSSCWTDRHPTSPSRCPLRREKKAERHHAVLRHEAVVHGLHVVLHLVGPGEFLAADRAREHLPLVALVVEESVSLEAVLVLERLLYVELRALGALVDTFGYRGVTKEIQAAHRHLGQLFGWILRVGRGATSHASLRHLAARRRRHRPDLMAARRRGVGGRCRAAATAAAAAVLRVVPRCRRYRRASRRRGRHRCPGIRGRAGRRAGRGRGQRGAAVARSRVRRLRARLVRRGSSVSSFLLPRLAVRLSRVAR